MMIPTNDFAMAGIIAAVAPLSLPKTNPAGTIQLETTNGHEFTRKYVPTLNAVMTRTPFASPLDDEF
ncbi:MAG: hypothetical protein IT582_08905 [Opitutaceae bacterium]|nr:hypothetical protein [Opitutaceae bacterium]